jgi:ferredoxin, 2Fe-2S
MSIATAFSRYNRRVIRVTFLPSGTTVEFETGTLPYGGHGRPGSLLDVARHFGVPLEHACGGNCACTSCHVVIRSGEGNLSPIQDQEEDRLLAAAGLTLHSRLACQCVVVHGEVVVVLP